MTIDHLADLLYPNMQNNIVPIILHVIGRVTAPIMFSLYVKAIIILRI